MQKLDKSRIKRCTAFLLAILLLLPFFPVSAVNAAEARASDYLEQCGAYVFCAGDGVIQVWFDVLGTCELDELGALEIQLYESTNSINWTWVATYASEDYPDMMGHDDNFHCSYVEYTQGISGRYYRAFVYIRVRDGGGGDSDCFYTSAKLAP